MATRSKKNGKEKPVEEHYLSGSNSGGEETGKGVNALEFSEKQMQTVSLLVQSVVSAAVAQVLPLARTQMASLSQNASGMASPPFSSAQGRDSTQQHKEEDDPQGRGGTR